MLCLHVVAARLAVNFGFIVLIEDFVWVRGRAEFIDFLKLYIGEFLLFDQKLRYFL